MIARGSDCVEKVRKILSIGKTHGLIELVSSLFIDDHVCYIMFMNLWHFMTMSTLCLVYVKMILGTGGKLEGFQHVSTFPRNCLGKAIYMTHHDTIWYLGMSKSSQETIYPEWVHATYRHEPFSGPTYKTYQNIRPLQHPGVLNNTLAATKPWHTSVLPATKSLPCWLYLLVSLTLY